MNMHQSKHNDGQAGRIRPDLQWLGTMIREVKFGAIRGALVRDGTIVKGPKLRITRTGKPGGKGAPGTRAALANDSVLRKALRDLADETIALSGEWKLKVKVVNGTILSWDVEEVGLSNPVKSK